MRWLVALSMLAATGLRGQAIPARPKVTEYQAHSVAAGFSLGADFHLHTLPAGRRNYLVEQYLVVEVAIYPVGREMTVSGGHFLLRLNGKKPGLMAQAPGFVAASMKYPDWEYDRRLEVGGGVGNAGVILGRPPVEPRFPGDQRVPRRPMPEPPHAPDGRPAAAVESVPELAPEEAVRSLALWEGPATMPVAGYLYFPFKGKLKGERRVELLYHGPQGRLVLQFQ